MFDSKSRTLDELRYKIGELGDQVTDAMILLDRGIELLTSNDYIYDHASVYKCTTTHFQLVSKSGQACRDEIIPFGDNPLSLCAVRGDTQVICNGNAADIYVPCYHGHHLLGELVVHSADFRTTDEDDITFLSEVVKYVKNRLLELGYI